MGDHSAEDRDPGNTDANEQLTEDLHPDDLADVLARFAAGHGVLHDDPPPGWTPDGAR